MDEENFFVYDEDSFMDNENSSRDYEDFSTYDRHSKDETRTSSGMREIPLGLMKTSSRKMETPPEMIGTFSRKMETPPEMIEPSSRKMETRPGIMETSSRKMETRPVMMETFSGKIRFFRDNEMSSKEKIALSGDDGDSSLTMKSFFRVDLNSSI